MMPLLTTRRTWVLLFSLPALIVLARDAMTTTAPPKYLQVDLREMSDIPFDQRSGQDEEIPRKWRALAAAYALLAAAAGVAGWRRRRLLARRLVSGRCRACGYDLRAAAEPGGPLLGRCPECGTVPGSAVPDGSVSAGKEATA